MIDKLRILAFVGSLRRESFNRMLLRQMVALAPTEAAKVEEFDLVSLPFYHGDLEGDLPEPVRVWKEAIRHADGILIVTPEYNYSIPALTKNAIDWGTRPPKDNVWKGKPVGIMGASNGRFGSVRCQQHLRNVLFAANTHVMNTPEVMISHAESAFDTEGNLVEDKAKQQLQRFWSSFIVWVRRFAGAGLS
jgi:chromate reductase